MKFKPEKKYVGYALAGFFALAGGILFYYVVFHSKSLFSNIGAIKKICMPILDGMILAYLMTPIMNWIEFNLVAPIYTMLTSKCKNPKPIVKQKKIIRGFSVVLTYITVVFMLYLFFMAVIPQLIQSITNIVKYAPLYVRNLERFGNGFLEDNAEIAELYNSLVKTYSAEINSYFNDNLLPQVNEFVRTLSVSFLGFFKALWNLILGFIISVYLLGSKEKFAAQSKRMAYSIFETKKANSLIDDIRFVHKTFIGFISGKIVDSVIIGLICFIGTTILNMPYAVLVSVIIGVTNVIPFFGPYLGAIPSTLLILMVNPQMALYFLIFIVILQQVDGNIIGPKILGDSTGLSGFWVIFSITLFGGFFGVLGMFIGVPVFAVFYAFVRRASARSLQRKTLSDSTLDYYTVDYIEDGNFVELSQDTDAKPLLYALRDRTKSKNKKNTKTDKEDKTK